MKKLRLLYPVLPVITLILEILPHGVVLSFANPEGEPFRQTFSYFSLTPYGYAHFTPLLTAAVTCAAFILTVIYCITLRQRAVIAAKFLFALGTVLSLGTFLYGTQSVTVISMLVTLTLAAELILLCLTVKKQK